MTADHSDSGEDDLDEEDVNFLEADCEGHIDEDFFVVIDDADVQQEEGHAEVKKAKKGKPKMTKKKNVNPFSWSDEITPFGLPLADRIVKWGAVKLTDLSSSSEPIEVFQSVSQIEQLVTNVVVPQSETYARQCGRVFETSTDEILAFIGINFLMGYHVLPGLKDYWSNEVDTGVLFVAECMTRERFAEIRMNLHFSDNTKDLARDDPQRDRAYKIRPLIEHFNESFANSLEPSATQAIDEHMIKFKGRNAMKQYMKNKPIKWGFKMWARCCSETGYLYQFDYYTGINHFKFIVQTIYNILF